MLSKFARPELFEDVRALLTPDHADALDAHASRSAFLRVFTDVVALIPGQRWTRTEELAQSMGLTELAGLK